MSEEFGRWLNKNWRKGHNISKKGNDEKYISVKAFGLWAFERYLDAMQERNRFSGAFWNFFDGISVHLEGIVIDCLGKKEFKERIKLFNLGKIKQSKATWHLGSKNRRAVK